VIVVGLSCLSFDGNHHCTDLDFVAVAAIFPGEYRREPASADGAAWDDLYLAVSLVADFAVHIGSSGFNCAVGHARLTKASLTIRNNVPA
jgi:hypothetical protein